MFGALAAAPFSAAALVGMYTDMRPERRIPVIWRAGLDGKP